MARPTPVPVRQAIFQLWQRRQDATFIAKSLGVNLATVRSLLLRFRRRGIEGIECDYHRSIVAEADLPEPVQLALRLRREHPTWGATMIRVHLLQAALGQPIPSERTLQRRFAVAGLSPAPVGRRVKVDMSRTTIPHETWQMDAKEQISILKKRKVSWLRLIDECSSAVLRTAVFPPRRLEPCPGR